MLIDFQSKFNNFNDVRFSDQVSGCDFEFSSVLRRWWKGWGKNGEDMEGSGPFNKSPFIELLQIYIIIVVVSFLTFWSSQLDFLQIADKFWIGANFNQFRPSFSLLLFAICDFFLTKNSLLQIKEGFSFVCVFNEVGYCKTKFCDDLFFVHLTTSQKICWELDFCLLINHSSCRDWITDKYWLTFGFE